MSGNHLNRREFVGITTAGIAGGVLGFGTPAVGSTKTAEWDPNRPLIVTGKTLNVQPVLMYRTPQRREATSWKSSGGVQTERAAKKRPIE